MLTTPKKSTRKLFLAAAFTLSLGAVATAVYAQRCSTYMGTSEGGRTVWLSCGSSAGNFIYSCSDGVCQEHPAFDDQADQLCAQGACSASQ